jgi:prevent-host-death family protein
MKRKPLQSVGSFAAKTHFSSLLERVAAGNVIEITRRGVPVAQLIPADTGAKKDRKTVIAELKRFAKGHRLGKLSIRKMIEEGRRF